MTALLILGAGGHAKPVIEALRASGIGLAGLLDDAPGGPVLGVQRLGTMAELPRLRAEGLDQAVVAIGDNATRAGLGATCRALGIELPAVIHPAALVSPSAVVGPGVQVMARAVVGASAALGALALVNTGAIVEHDCLIAEAAHIGPGAVLCGAVRIGPRALVGAGAVVRPEVAIGADAVIAAGAAVAKDVPARARVGGVPARAL
ncbi:MAG TPA: NeuD/PglB/VioB family sugar acetyltransferase [Falsiroseomonas sp.]|nr:NeuD/PglB/VioB family sugar acetyltransferase [Falsiroseomonas sp.]